MKQWKVPLSDIDLSREEIEALVGVLKTRWLTMGPLTKKFETAFAQFLGVKYAFAVANGTAALEIANQAIGLKTGDEVICPSLSFVATANTILHTGATPIFADSTSLDDWTIAPADIKKKITSRTRAIIVMHYGGYPCAMDEIMAVARAHNLSVIEDAAHAVGSEYRGKKCGTVGDIGCFSFFSNKNLVTGEGGMIVTNDDSLARKIVLLRSHGMTSLTWERHQHARWSYDVVLPGYNYRIDELRSAIGIVQLKKLKRANHHRAQLVRLYRKRLEGQPAISIPFRQAGGALAYHLFVILLAEGFDRERIMASLAQAGIQSSVHYTPIHLFTCYRPTDGLPAAQLPVTEEVGRREITLPLYSTMGVRNVHRVVAALGQALRSTVDG